MDGVMSPNVDDSPLRTKAEQPKSTTPPKPQRRMSNSLPKVNSLVLITSDDLKPLSSPRYDRSKKETFFEQVFERIDKLGSGSFGVVLLAKSREDKLEYAVKIIGKSSSIKYAEVRNHMILTHPNIVQFVRAWEEQGILHIQTELCVRSLGAYLEENHKLPEEIVWNTFIDILRALHYMHSIGMIHNDIKPDNIMMTKHLVCKLGDFGVAVKLDDEKQVEEAEDGDNKYLASEAVGGKPTKASDVFSLGVTVLEMITNLRLPGNGSGWREIRNGEIPERLLKDVSEELKTLTAKMLNINASKRPTTAELLEHPEIKSRLEDRIKFVEKCSEEALQPTQCQSPAPTVESSTVITPATPTSSKHRPTSQPTQCQTPVRRVKSSTMITPITPPTSRPAYFQSPVRPTFRPSVMETPTTSRQSTKMRYSEASEDENMPCQQRAQSISRSRSDLEHQQLNPFETTPKKEGARVLERIPAPNFNMENQQQPMASASTPTSSRPQGTRRPMRRSALDFTTNSNEAESSTGCPKIKRAKSFSHKETD